MLTFTFKCACTYTLTFLKLRDHDDRAALFLVAGISYTPLTQCKEPENVEAYGAFEIKTIFFCKCRYFWWIYIF